MASSYDIVTGILKSVLLKPVLGTPTTAHFGFLSHLTHLPAH